MSERPETSRTRLAWWATVLVMVLITVVLLLAYSPWNDPTPGLHKPKKTHNNVHLDTGRAVGPSVTAAR